MTLGLLFAAAFAAINGDQLTGFYIELFIFHYRPLVETIAA